MPTGGASGVILIGSSDKNLQQNLAELLAENFDAKVLCVRESSDFLLEILDKNVMLTIIDINLIGLPVAKTIQILKKCRPRIPVIVLSDDYTVATGSSIMEQGIFYYMYKPLEADRFKEIVRSALNKHAKDEIEERR